MIGNVYYISVVKRKNLKKKCRIRTSCSEGPAAPSAPVRAASSGHPAASRGLAVASEGLAVAPAPAAPVVSSASAA